MAKRTRDDAERRLARYWNPPVSLPTDGASGAGRPLACIATTYTFHASLFETDLLPRFLGLRFDSTERERTFVVERERALSTTTVSLLVDQDHLDAGQTTLRWDQLPVDVPGGVQHAKLSLLLWERCLRLIVGSANITRSGYRRNREMAAAIDFFDGEESAPREVAVQALQFVQDLADSGWIRAAKPAVERLQVALDDMRGRLSAWDRMPRDFTPRELPTLTFVGGLPARPGRARRSAMAQFIALWGNRRARELTVMTPFVAESEEGATSVVRKVLEIPRRADATLRLVVPGIPSEKDPRKMVVPLPAWFRDSWLRESKRTLDDLEIWVVPPRWEGLGEKMPRDLHAKGILVRDEERLHLLVGSSNFSPRGMGVGAANVEANLCFEDQDGSPLGTALPADERDWTDNATWQDMDLPSEDDKQPRVPRLPRVFAWATCVQQTGILTLGFNADSPLPSEWAVFLPQGAEAEVLLVNRDVLPALPKDLVWMKGPDDGLKRLIAFLKVRWRPAMGADWCSALLAVQTVSQGALLPPEEFRGLTADGIIACLLSGRDPSEPDPDAGPGGPDKPPVDRFDPLRFVDTTDYPMYRSRRLGRALATLGDRIVRTVRTRVAFAYRLESDPLGPISLATAIAGEQKATAEPVVAGFAASYVLFALSEIQLTLAYAGHEVHRGRGALEPDLRTLFVRAIDRIESLRQGISSDAGHAAAGSYSTRVREKCEQLLGATVAGGADAR